MYSRSFDSTRSVGQFLGNRRDPVERAELRLERRRRIEAAHRVNAAHELRRLDHLQIRARGSVSRCFASHERARLLQIVLGVRPCSDSGVECFSAIFASTAEITRS